MCEILFRGKRLDNNEWVEGFYAYIECDNRHVIIAQDTYTEYGGLYYFTVDIDTVGQYIGLTDKNGNKIFEGDVVTFETTAYSFKPCVVAWSFTKMRFIVRGREANYPMDIGFKYEVIGNIHDNPELLENP